MGLFGFGKREAPPAAPPQEREPQRDSMDELFSRIYEKRERIADDPELERLRHAINKENPMGLFFVKEDGTLTNEPWVVTKIYPQKDERGTIHHIRLSPVGNPGVSDEYSLGDFMKNRLIRKSKED